MAAFIAVSTALFSIEMKQDRDETGQNQKDS
jgi:hypothetical protein